MDGTVSIIESADVLSTLGLVVLFALANCNARYAVVYRRNKVATVAAVILAATGFFLWGWTGLLAFAAGTAIGAGQWAREIRLANESITGRCGVAASD